MKVLFAVSNEKISEGIVKQYQKDYKEILSYKNVYYFDAILKEIQNDKTYDRIVIQEELEQFPNNNYEAIDKFLFEKLDNISDEAQDINGQETSIIFICTDRRAKGSGFLVKLFSIGVYNALLGSDRVRSEVCKLIAKPRIKKEAKMYYGIDAEDAKYDQSSDNEVTEIEIQNIRSHFKKLGKNTDKYAESFNNISVQYTDEQMKIIINCLPVNVKQILEQTSPKYQEIMAASGGKIRSVANLETDMQEKESGINMNLIEGSKTNIDRPIVIPSAVKRRTIVNNNVGTSSTGTVKRTVVNGVNKGNVAKKVEKPEPVAEQPKLPKEDLVDDVFTDLNDIVADDAPVNEVKKTPAPEVNDDLPMDDMGDLFSDVNDDISLPGFDDNTSVDEDLDDLIPSDEVEEVPAKEEVKPEPVEEEVIPEKKREESEDEEESDDLLAGFEDSDDGDLGDLLGGFDDDNSDLDDLIPSDEVEETPVKEEVKPEPVEEPEEADDLLAGFEDNTDDGDLGDLLGGFDDDSSDLDDLIPSDEVEETPVKEEVKPEPVEETVEEPEETDDLLPGFDDDTSSDVSLPGFEDDSDDGDLDDLLGGFGDDDSSGDLDDLIPADEVKDTKLESAVEEDSDEGLNDAVDIPGLDDLDDLDAIPSDDSLESADDDIVGDLPGMDFDSVDDLEGLDDLPSMPEEPTAPVETETVDTSLPEDDAEGVLPDFDDTDDLLSDLPTDNIDDVVESVPNTEVVENPTITSIPKSNTTAIESVKSNIDYSMSNLNSLLTKENKIVTFIGTTKNGTSFLINNLALLFNQLNVNTAILDMTKNRNSYYIYTNNDEELRNISSTCLENLEEGTAKGIRVADNLTVYTAIPDNGKTYTNAESMLSTLVQNHSLILIDCDFDTDPSFFASCQEIYLVQSMDVLTIQPLTAFLKNLKNLGVLEPEKIRIAINKYVKLKEYTAKDFVAGMSCYNDPSMSIMTDLFNREMVKFCTIDFEEGVYARYLDAMASCKLSLEYYSKSFKANLTKLGEMVYPLSGGSRPNFGSRTGGTVNPMGVTPNQFSRTTSSTLDKMRKKI